MSTKMKCPLCNEGNLNYRQDSQLVRTVLKGGKLPAVANVSVLDNTELECDSCYECCDTSSEIQKIKHSIKYVAIEKVDRVL